MSNSKNAYTCTLNRIILLEYLQQQQATSMVRMRVVCFQIDSAVKCVLEYSSSRQHYHFDTDPANMSSSSSHVRSIVILVTKFDIVTMFLTQRCTLRCFLHSMTVLKWFAVVDRESCLQELWDGVHVLCPLAARAQSPAVLRARPEVFPGQAAWPRRYTTAVITG